MERKDSGWNDLNALRKRLARSEEKIQGYLDERKDPEYKKLEYSQKTRRGAKLSYWRKERDSVKRRIKQLEEEDKA